MKLFIGFGRPHVILALTFCLVVELAHTTYALLGDGKVSMARVLVWLVINFGIAVLESISYGCPVVISDQVYLGDDLPQGSEVLGLGQQGWTEFLEKRMVDETWRAQRCAIDRRGWVAYWPVGYPEQCQRSGPSGQ